MSFRIAKFYIKWLFYDEVARLDIFINQYFNIYKWWVGFKSFMSFKISGGEQQEAITAGSSCQNVH